MLKKILSASLIILQIFTQSASALELRPIIQPAAIQPFQSSSDILKNKMPFSGVSDFLFFNISDISVNQPLAFGQGLSVYSGVIAGQTLSNRSGWRLTGAYRANFPTLITLNGFRGNPSSDSRPLPAAKDGILLGINDVGFSGNNEAAVIDTRSELTGSNRYLGTNIAVLTSPVPAETRSFTYDPIGNRTNMTVGTTAGTYTANNLNQYTAQTGPANTFTHDFDGNLSQITGTRNVVFTYDGENRLLSVQPVTPVANNKRLEFVYDYQGRRVQKLVYNRSGSSWVLQTTKRFVYDGWNMVEEQTVSGTTKYYVYGLDLSQSLQGAGGVGGLLAKAEGTATHQYFYDANGNISQMINASSGAVDARYEYDAYGNSILATGTQAAGNTMRFSTKYLDTEFSLYYYGYRYYDPATGRWVNRDPWEEKGGLNLYEFVFNTPLYYFDDTGRSPMTGTPTKIPLEILERIPTKTPKIPAVVAVTFAAVLGDYIADRIEDFEDGPIKYYVTYIFKDECKIVRYVGRTGGNVNRADLFWQMQADILANRVFNRRKDNHHIDLNGLDGEVDKAVRGDVPRAKDIIRGREQQLIDANGKAWNDDHDTPLLNIRRGVAKDNELGREYHMLSTIYFGQQLHEYTGH